MTARPPEWRALFLAVRHVAEAIKDAPAAFKIEQLEHALAQGWIKTRAARLIADDASYLPGFDPHDGLPTSIWQEHRRLSPGDYIDTVFAPKIRFRENTVSGYIGTELIRVDAEGVEVYWPDMLKIRWEEIRWEETAPLTERADAGTASLPSPEEPPARPGRPPVHDWFKIAVVMCWHLSGKAPRDWQFSGKRKLTRDEYLEKLQKWCEQELGTKPSIDELKPRYALVRKWFKN
jgi:hypothetical protein